MPPTPPLPTPPGGGGRPASTTTSANQPSRGTPVRARAAPPRPRPSSRPRPAQTPAPAPPPPAVLHRPPEDTEFRPGVDADAIPERDLDDDELAALLGSGPELDEAAAAALRDKLRARQAAKHASIMASSAPAISVTLLRPIDPFDTWVWFKSPTPLTPDQLDLLDGVWTAWHLLGRLGAFNGSNLQLFHGEGIATKAYDADRLESAATTVFHDAGEVEAGPGGGGGGGVTGAGAGAAPAASCWARAWVNLGTADELALDVLANALGMLAKENVPLTAVVISSTVPPELGDAWPLPPPPEDRDLAALGLSPDAFPMGADLRDY